MKLSIHQYPKKGPKPNKEISTCPKRHPRSPLTWTLKTLEEAVLQILTLASTPDLKPPFQTTI